MMTYKTKNIRAHINIIYISRFSCIAWGHGTSQNVKGGYHQQDCYECSAVHENNSLKQTKKITTPGKKHLLLQSPKKVFQGEDLTIIHHSLKNSFN